jgi:HEAT repeat protein
VELSAVRASHFRSELVDTEPLVERAAAAVVGGDTSNAVEGLRVLRVAGQRLGVVADAARSLNPQLRTAAVQSLAGFDPDDPTVIDTLADALGDENGYVVAAALRVVVSDRRQGRFVREVRDLCNDDIASVRNAALSTLGAVSDGDRDDVERLAAGLGHTDRRVVEAALAGARTMADERLAEPVSDVLIDWVSARSVKPAHFKKVLSAARTCGVTDAAVDVVLELLERPTARTEAARVLARVGDPRAIEPLRWLLSDQSETLRTAATQALAAIDGGLDDEVAGRCWADPTESVRYHVIGWLSHRTPLSAVWHDRLRHEAVTGPAVNRPAALAVYSASTGNLDLARRRGRPCPQAAGRRWCGPRHGRGHHRALPRGRVGEGDLGDGRRGHPCTGSGGAAGRRATADAADRVQRRRTHRVGTHP